MFSTPADKNIDNDDTSTTKETVVQKEPTFTKADVESIVSAAVKEAIAQYKAPVERTEIKENKDNIGDLIKNTQAKLIEPQPIPTERNEKLDLVKNILQEYQDKKEADASGKVFYKNNEDGLFKSKIIMMKKMGMSEEEIANIL